MGFLSDLFKFENVFSVGITKDILKKPTRLLTGIDPASTKVWNKVLGKDDKPLVNVFGSPGKQYYDLAAQKGINVGPAGTFHSLADMIAGFYGAQGVAGIGSSGPAGYLGVPSGTPSTIANKALINSGMKAGNNLSNGQGTFDGVLQAGLSSGLKSGVNSMGNGMSGFGDFFGNLFKGGSGGGSDSTDTTDWLGSIETDLDGNAPYNPDFTNYGNPGSDGFTIGDSFGDTDYYNDMFSQISDAEASSPGFLDNLMKQFGQIGSNVKGNPLGALQAALGAYGSYREATGGEIPAGTLNAVEQLMLKGDVANAYTPQPVKYGQPIARDYRHFMQSYDKDGNATQTSRNDALTNDTYQKVLGRNADTGGADFWSGIMDKGMNRQQLEHELLRSPEKRINDAYQKVLGRKPDFDGMNYYAGAMNNGLRPEQLQQMLGGSQENGINSLYREELGRDPDQDGLDYYSHMLNGGLTMDQMRADLHGSAEGVKRQGALSAALPAPTAPTPVPYPANPVPGVPTAVNKVPNKLYQDYME